MFDGGYCGRKVLMLRVRQLGLGAGAVESRQVDNPGSSYNAVHSMLLRLCIELPVQYSSGALDAAVPDLPQRAVSACGVPLPQSAVLPHSAV